MTTDLSLISLIVEASLLVQLVMLILLAASILSWTLIIRKWQLVKQTRAAAEVFEGRFWSGIDLVDLYRQVSKNRDRASGLESLFEGGFREFARLRQLGADKRSIHEGVERALRVALSREGDRLESNLNMLATIGSTSPYVGLFGTVWGIMNSFRALGGVQHATMAMVAPGIAEALIATAMGLFAAIPAVIAYNRYTHETERLLTRYENFAEEFMGVLLRQVGERPPGAAKTPQGQSTTEVEVA